MLSLLISSLFFIKKEIAVYFMQIFSFMQKLYRKTFNSKRNKGKNIRSIRKELYNPLIEAAKPHISLNIRESFGIRGRKPIKLMPLSLNLNKTCVVFDNDKEKKVVFSSLPQEFTNKTINSENNKEINVRKTIKNVTFLPSTLLKLEDFQQLNKEFANKCGEKIVNKEFKIKMCEVKGANFLDIHNKLTERGCKLKKCSCLQKKNSAVEKKNGFKPTFLTPIIENVYYK